MTNIQLKRVIDKIVVNEHGKIDTCLKLLSDIGLEQSVPVNYLNTQAIGDLESIRLLV